jgi:L-ascorbate metabolism protein UlaG (beta-lactamase superfamily)
VGHSTVLLELDGVRLLTDPVLRDRAGPLVRIAPPAAAASGVGIDAVLLSHLHADHLDLPSLRRLHGPVTVLAPRGAGAWLRAQRVRGGSEIGVGEERRVGPLSVTAVRAKHDARRRPFGPHAEPLGYVVRGSNSVYFAGDTDLFPAMADLAGSIDVALLPVWGWGPALGPGHLDPSRAADAAALIQPRVAVPIHWGTLALPRLLRRPMDQSRPAREFHALTARRAPAVEVRVLAPGDRTELE